MNNYLNIDYSMHKYAKELGCIFDKDEKRWYTTSPSDKIKSLQNLIDRRIYLNVPYKDRDFAKSAGCKYEPKFKAWWTYPCNFRLNDLMDTYKVLEDPPEEKDHNEYVKKVLASL